MKYDVNLCKPKVQFLNVFVINPYPANVDNIVSS